MLVAVVAGVLALGTAFGVFTVANFDAVWTAPSH
jgi:hypothetical protein